MNNNQFWLTALILIFIFLLRVGMFVLFLIIIHDVVKYFEGKDEE